MGLWVSGGGAGGLAVEDDGAGGRRVVELPRFPLPHPLPHRQQHPARRHSRRRHHPRKSHRSPPLAAAVIPAAVTLKPDHVVD